MRLAPLQPSPSPGHRMGASSRSSLSRWVAPSCPPPGVCHLGRRRGSVGPSAACRSIHEGRDPNTSALQGAPAPGHTCGHNCNFPPHEAGKLHPRERGWWLSRKRRLPLQGQGATGGWTASAFQAPGEDGGGSGSLLPGTSQACQRRDTQLGRTGGLGRGRWQPQLNLFSAAPPRQPVPPT